MQLNYFNITLALYFLSFFSGVIWIVSNKRIAFWALKSFLGLGLLSHCAYFWFRWSSAGFLPLSNLFESLVFFSFSVVILYFIFGRKLSVKYFHALVALVAFLILGYASRQPSSIAPLMPALRSNWLTIHVATCFLGYAGFTLAFVMSWIILFKRNSNLEDFVDSTIKFGVLFLFLGIATGAVWANQAWGTYWSWDPKETWSLITWMVYGVYLVHARWFNFGRKTKALMSMLGFAFVIMTYLGVNYLPSASQSLHTY